MMVCLCLCDFVIIDVLLSDYISLSYYRMGLSLMKGKQLWDGRGQRLIWSCVVIQSVWNAMSEVMGHIHNVNVILKA